MAPQVEPSPWTLRLPEPLGKMGDLLLGKGVGAQLPPLPRAPSLALARSSFVEETQVGSGGRKGVWQSELGCTKEQGCTWTSAAHYWECR